MRQDPPVAGARTQLHRFHPCDPYHFHPPSLFTKTPRPLSYYTAVRINLCTWDRGDAARNFDRDAILLGRSDREDGVEMREGDGEGRTSAPTRTGSYYSRESSRPQAWRKAPRFGSVCSGLCALELRGLDEECIRRTQVQRNR